MQPRSFFSAQAVLLGARLLGAGIGFLSQLLLARALPPGDLALFYAATSMAAIAGLVCAQGYPGVAARFMSRYRERARPKELAGFVGQARRHTFASAVLAAAVVAAISLSWPSVTAESRAAFLIAAISIPAFASISLYGAFGGAIRRFYTSLLPEMIIRPGLFLVIVAALIATPFGVTGAGAVLAMCGVAGAVAVAQWLTLTPHVPKGAPARSRAIARRWRHEAWPLVLVMMFTGLFADLAILAESAFLDGIDLAAFSISIKLALLVGYAVQLAHQFVLPDLADSYARRDIRHIRRRLLRAAGLPVSVCLGALIATHFFGERLLGVFGQSFVYAAGPLTLMIACQLLRAAAGPSTSLLTLEGAQRTNSVCCGLSCVVLLIASAILAPRFGLWGAAIALTITYCVWIGASGIALYRRSGVRTDLPALLADLMADRPIRGAELPAPQR